MNLFATPRQKAQEASLNNAIAVSNYLNNKNRKAEKAQLNKLKAAQALRCNTTEMALENQELYGA